MAVSVQRHILNYGAAAVVDRALGGGVGVIDCDNAACTAAGQSIARSDPSNIADIGGVPSVLLNPLMLMLPLVSLR